MESITIPEELLEQFERGNVLLFVGERIVRDAGGQALVDRLSAQLAARSQAAGEGELSFVQATQAYEDSAGRQALVQFLRDQCAGSGVPFFDKRDDYLAREFPVGRDN